MSCGIWLLCCARNWHFLHYLAQGWSYTNEDCEQILRKMRREIFC